jgi:uncharacterized protein (TIGR02466 family)
MNGELKMNILGVFPIPVAVTELGRDFTDTELSFINSALKSTMPNSGNSISTDKHIVRNPEMKDLESFILDKLNIFLSETNPPKDNGPEIYITQSWLNFVKQNEHHHFHYHPNSFISGVFYIDAKLNNDKIWFTNPRMPAIQYPTDNWTIFNSEECFFAVNTGTLLLFPSYLMHQVKTKIENENRISLAFNTFLKGNLGSEEHLTELII